MVFKIHMGYRYLLEYLQVPARVNILKYNFNKTKKIKYNSKIICLYFGMVYKNPTIKLPFFFSCAPC